MNKTVACYVRVSTIEQNPQGQIDDIKRWLDRNGISPAAVEWYEDRDSGAKIARNAFKRMEKRIEDGTHTTVVVWHLDRISRKMVDGMNVVAAWADKGVRFVSIMQQVDITGIMGRMIATLLFGFAEMELKRSKERQAVGIQAAKERGVYKGRMKGTTKAEPARAIALKAKGLAIEEIATAMGCSLSTVYRYLA
jgi:DNA invertase Pin-like site-specific DNA recombinase